MAIVDGFTSMTPSVFETEDDPVIVQCSHIRQLVTAAQAAPSGRARLILHTNRNDDLHEMIVALPPDSCDHPHVNFQSGKSFFALSGQFALIWCADDGSKFHPIILSAGPHQGNRMVRLRKPVWHTIIPLNGDTVFLETIRGPFVGNCYAPWFPAASRVEERKAFVEKLRGIARDHYHPQRFPSYC
jgi:cupin fold WbuC family metalloprotein